MTPPKAPWWKSQRTKTVALAAGATAVVGLLVWFFAFHPYVRTDDARVAMTLVRVAPSGIGGRIVKVAVTEGSLVKKGDVLVEIDHRLAQANFDKAKAKYELSARERDRLQRLYSENSTTQQSLDVARANAESARAEMQQAEINLENTTLTSPFDGIVVQKLAEEGNLLEPGQTAVVVADYRNAWIAANIEETSVADVKPGQKVHVSIDEGGSLEGEVLEVRAAVAAQFALIPSDNGAGNFTKVVQRIPVKIALKTPLDRVLRAGQSVEIKIRVR